MTVGLWDGCRALGWIYSFGMAVGLRDGCRALGWL